MVLTTESMCTDILIEMEYYVDNLQGDKFLHCQAVFRSVVTEHFFFVLSATPVNDICINQPGEVEIGT